MLSRTMQIRVLVDGDTTAGRGIVEGVAAFAQGLPTWHLRVDLNPLRIGAHDDVADGTIYGTHYLEWLERFRTRNRPVVGCLAHHQHTGIPLVRADDRAVGVLAARYFLDRGFERFVFASMNDRSLAATLRWEGFAATVRQAGFEAQWRPPNVHADPLDIDEIRQGGGPLALFAGHDAVGRNIAHLVVERGLAVPDDVAVLGVDDDEFQCAFSRPTLSSVAVPHREIGRQAAALLGALLAGGQAPAAALLVAPIGVTTRESTDIVCADDPRLAMVLRLIRERACAPCDVKQIVAEACVSRRWLEQEFRRRYGHSPHAALMRVRMTRARALLRNPLVPIKEVSARCGYPYAQNFVAAFRKTVGETPAAYRRRHSGVCMSAT